jgi:hypothetical protein
MIEAIYVLCAATALMCAALLFRGYYTTGHRLLFWSALCFAGLAANNLLMVVDFLVVPAADLSIARHLTGMASLGILLFGLVWETP